MEIWKDIPGYEGMYLASNEGRIKSIKKKFGKFEVETILKPAKIWTGYLRVALTKNGKTKQTYIHRLVALTFIPNPENKPIINHINGNILDNRVENLEWVTHKENSNASQLMKSSDRYNSIKVKDNQGNTFNSYREAGRYWNISMNTVKNDVLKRTKKGKNFKREVRFERG